MPTLHIPINAAVSYDILDPSQDLIKLEPPNPSDATVTKVSINSIGAAEGAPTIELRNQASGAGSAITVTFSDGNRYAEQTGSLSLTDFLWVRSGSVVGGLSNINITIRYNYGS